MTPDPSAPKGPTALPRWYRVSNLGSHPPAISGLQHLGPPQHAALSVPLHPDLLEIPTSRCSFVDSGIEDKFGEGEISGHFSHGVSTTHQDSNGLLVLGFCGHQHRRAGAGKIGLFLQEIWIFFLYLSRENFLDTPSPQKSPKISGRNGSVENL